MRPAVTRIAAVGLAALAACWSGKTDSSMPAPGLEAGSRDITGPYWCSIDSDADAGPRYPCMIKRVGGRLMLAKLGGQQRIRGNVVLDEADGSFTFTGELYCPDGDCTERMRGRFRPNGGGFEGALNGKLDHRHSTMIVHLVPAPANAFGGAGYGGDGYGDPFGYGGASYGGATYGLNRIDRRGRRRP